MKSTFLHPYINCDSHSLEIIFHRCSDMKKIFSLVAIFVLLASSFIGTSSNEPSGSEMDIAMLSRERHQGETRGDTIIVDDDGGQDHTTIQAAVDAANRGDTIRVWAGTYNERVYIEETMTVIGNGSADTLIRVSGAETGVWINDVTWVNVTGFNITSGIGGDAILIGNAAHCRIENNSCGNGTYGIRVWQSESNIIANNHCSRNEYGIFLHDSESNVLLNNICYNNSKYGIHLYDGSDGNTVDRGDCSNNQHGIFLDYAESNVIKHVSTISNSEYGIYVYFSSNNTISRGNAEDNKRGIFLDYSAFNLVRRNTFSDNSEHGLYLYYSDSNEVHHNNFIDNNGGGLQGKDEGANNNWDDRFSGGNYWSDYESLYPQADNDGSIWDTPYSIDGLAASQDNYPLVEPIIRDPHIEQDEFGGSWFDDFDDDGGIEESGRIGLIADAHTVGLWHMNEGQGNITRDSSRFGNDGDLKPENEQEMVNWTSNGKSGFALEFDNRDDHLDCGNDASLAITDRITIEAWIYPRGWGEAGLPGYGRIVYKKAFQLLLTGGNKHTLDTNLKIGGSYHTIQTPQNSISLNTWQHIAVTYDSQEVCVYINGKSQTLQYLTQIPSGSIDDHTDEHLYIGNTHELSKTFNGIIDEVRISDNIRSPGEIKRNYAGGLILRNGEVELKKSDIGSEAGCVGYWSFDEGYGNKAYDWSESGNNGALTNMEEEDWVDGVSGKALEFDGVNEYVKIGLGDNLFSTEGAIEVWFKWISTAPTDFGHILQIGTDGPNNYQMFIMLGDSTGTYNDESMGIYMTNGGGPFIKGHVRKGHIFYQDDIWHHIIWFQNGCGHGLFIDGENETPGMTWGFGQQSDNTWWDDLTENDNIFIGCGRDSGIEYSHLNGTIDEVAIYNRALTPYEIGQHYNRTLYTTNANLTSVPIELPENMDWDSLSIRKTEPADTFVNVSVINSKTNETIGELDNLTKSNVDLSYLNDNGISSIRLKAYFSGNGSATPTLDSWGVEWVAENAWRDSFIGDLKVDYPYGIDENTVGCWRFEEGCGNLARDSSSYRNNGTLYHMNDENWAYRGKGRALELDGGYDHVRIPFNESINISQEITLEAWVRPNLVREGMYVINKPGPSNSFSFWVEWDGQIRFIINENSLGSNGRLSVGEWSHVVGTYDGEKMSLYFDGELDNQIAFSKKINTSISDLYIGNSYYTSNMAFNGTMDDVRISDIARTPMEIREAYEAGAAIQGGQVQLGDNEAIPEGNTTAFWNFNEGSGTLLNDNSGNGNDGVIHGANWTEGIMGGALDFDGVDDYVDLSDSSDWNFGNGDFTIGLWIKRERISPTAEVEMLMGQGSTVDDAAFSVRFDTDGTIRGTLYDISSLTYYATGPKVSDMEWHYVEFQRSDSTLKIFLDGSVGDTTGVVTGVTMRDSNKKSLLGTWNGDGAYFMGRIDSVSIWNRTLSAPETRGMANRYRTNATLRSETIELPSDHVWNRFHFERLVPDNTDLNITVYDADTDEILESNVSHNSDEEYIDLTAIYALDHSSIYFEAALLSNRTQTPILNDWAVNWTPMEAPELLMNIDNVTVFEDASDVFIVDLSEHFLDPYRILAEPRYDFEYDGNSITLDLIGSNLTLSGMDENYTGNVTVRSNCTNAYNLTTYSNYFNITVIDVGDGPILLDLPPVELQEDSNTTTEWSLDDYIIDAENDEMEFFLTPEDANITVELTPVNRLNISLSKDYFGNSHIIVYAREVHNHSQITDNRTIWVDVLPDNDPPQVELISPQNNTPIIIDETEDSINLTWKGSDIDDVEDNITYDLFLGVNKTPDDEPYQSDVPQTRYELTGLSMNTTYYWSVRPFDGTEFGECHNGTWNFMILEDFTFPKVKLKFPLDNEPLNKKNVTLIWELNPPLNRSFTFEILLGESSESLNVFDKTTNLSFDLDGLEETTYYWSIQISSKGIKGNRSEVRNFTIDLAFNATYNITIDVDAEELNIVQGKRANFNLTLTNEGNVPTAVVLSSSGTGAVGGLVKMVRNVTVSVNTSENIPVSIEETSSLVLGNYEITIGIYYPNITKTITMPVNIISQEELDPGEKKEPDSYLSLILGIAMLVIILAIIAYFIWKRRRETEEEHEEAEVDEDTIVADIVHVPIPGETTTVPVQPVATAPPPQEAGMDPRYRVKGRDAGMPPGLSGTIPAQPQVPVGPPSPMPPPATGTPQAGQEIFDLSKLHIPIPSEGKVVDLGKVLALPPAKIIDVKEEQLKIPIEEVFLMTPAGLLVQHYSLQQDSGLNEDILASMLSAVKSFIADSLAMLDETAAEKGDVNRIDFGKYSVMMASGQSLALVAITAHEEKEAILEEIYKGVNVIEERFGEMFVDWDGDMSKVEGITPYIEHLVKGEFDEENIAKLEESTEKPAEEPTLPAPPEQKPELPAGVKTVTIALPDPVKIPDTRRALPEKTEVTQDGNGEVDGGRDVLSALEDILGGEGSAAPAPGFSPDIAMTPPQLEAQDTDGEVPDIASAISRPEAPESDGEVPAPMESTDDSAGDGTDDSAGDGTDDSADTEDTSPPSA